MTAPTARHIPSAASPWRTRFSNGLTVVVSALSLSAAALWNGQAFFYPDTPTYLRGAEMGFTKLTGLKSLEPWAPGRADNAPVQSGTSSVPADAGDGAAQPPTAAAAPKALTSIDDKVVLAGRSVYYGALLYASHLSRSGMWLTVAVQALSVAWLLHLLMVRLWGLRRRQAVAMAAGLSLLTPLGVYTGFLMPDVFASLVLLCIGTLAVYWDRLPKCSRWALAALLLFGLCAHTSHLAVGLGLWLLLAIARCVTTRWKTLHWPALAVVGACLVGGLLAEWGFNQAVTRFVGAPPLRLPHPMARLVDMGPGTDYLQKNCPESGYVACDHVQNFPTHWISFLFATSPDKGAFALEDTAGKRQMADEQLAFVADVLRHDPAGVIGGVAADILRQILRFRVDIWGYDNELAGYAGRVPDDIHDRMQQSRAAGPTPYNRWLSWASQASVLGSVALAGFWAWRRRAAALPQAGAPSTARRAFTDFSVIVVAGVLTNAVVCATLASSWDRFQSRLIWLIPFLALAALAGASAQRRATAAGPLPSAFPSPTPLSSGVNL